MRLEVSFQPENTKSSSLSSSSSVSNEGLISESTAEIRRFMGED